MSHHLIELGALGQSPWYDFITRDLVQSGELARLIREEGLRGMTSNPTIFEHAVTGSSDYDTTIAEQAARGIAPAAIVDSIVVADVKSACGVFLPLYKQSVDGDGVVSIEVAPELANDTKRTIAEGKRLWSTVDSPNLMVKVPATSAGLPAIEELTALGINVNITLLFSVDRYREVINAFWSGLERRMADGQPIDNIHSVASFFVSRVDGKTDPILEQAGDAAAPLLHKIGIANARDAHGVFLESLEDPRWKSLSTHGAQVQRPLWASTSTKDPSLSDIYYIEALIAANTVNTIPPKTWKAYADHGKPQVRITTESIAAARNDLSAYDALDVTPLSDVTDELEKEGVSKFTKSWETLRKAVEDKSSALAHSA